MTWIDRHSINCCICDKLIDEREALSFIGAGSYCAEHHPEIVKLAHKLCRYINQAGTNIRVYVDDNKTELMHHDITGDWADTLPMDDALDMLRQAILTPGGNLVENPGAMRVWANLRDAIGI